MTSSTSRLIEDLTEKYRYVMSQRDPRGLGWGLVADLRFILPVAFGYLYVVKIAGPKWMAHRKPYNVKSAVMVYNLFQVIVNTFFFVQYMRYSYVGGGYSVFCQGVSYSTDENAMMIVHLSWWYIFVRIADFMDTFFFLAAKKFSHITFLHVFHHFLVVLNGWVWFNFGCGGQGVMAICVNSMIHVIMYGYYFLSALGPGVQKYLWWKRYLTGVQIFQMAFLSLHVSVPLFYECGVPKILIFLAVPQCLLGLVLFVNFYVRAYILKKKADVCFTQAVKDE